ncbi:MAG TPA: hypothetical protein VFA20_29635 [Myxococcaceae bacterium]|nr:hypothetical protein [Myxococcaceae bacterium]
MKKILGLATTALLATACGRDFRAGLPTKEMVEVPFPQSSSQGLQAQGEVSNAKTSTALQGQLADGYVLTRSATGTVNGGTLFVLGLLKAITDNPPTSQAGNTAVWGPGHDTLSRNTYQLTVVNTQGNDYAYALEGRANDAPDTAFVRVLGGTHTAASDDKGHGSFLLDWDAAATLPDHDDNIGSVIIGYGNDNNDHGAVAVVARFEGVRDQDTGGTVNANYAYLSVPGVGGGFEFGVRKNMNPAEGTTLENFTIKSRWLSSGAGRSDAQVSGGDLGANQATWNECWDTSFLSQFVAVSYDTTAGYGTESANCAIQGAEYANL